MHGPAEDSEERQQLADEMKVFGASDEDVAEFLRSRKDLDADFYVYEENWPTVLWFLDVSDQFTFTQGICTGVNLPGIKADAEMAERDYTSAQYKSLRTMMRTAVKELNARMET